MALASPLQLIANDNAPKKGRLPRVRFSPIVNLENGEVEGAAAQTDLVYEEHAFFGFAKREDYLCPAAWLGQVVERAGRYAMMRGLTGRPMSVVAPAAALAHPDAPMAAEAGACRAQICQQEIRLEFADYAVVEEEYSSIESLYGFHRRGFRLGLDARSGWKTPMDTDLRFLIEAVRLDVHHMEDAGVDIERFDAASMAGVQLYAENVSWRDAETMLGLGVTHAIAPGVDS